MNRNIELLDCTLRDGAYIVESHFGTKTIAGLIANSVEAGINIIECGWLKNNNAISGSTYFHEPNDLLPYLKKKRKNACYVVMIDWDRYDLDNLPEYDGRTVDAIRVVFPHDKFLEGIEIGNEISKKGYRVFLQAANTLAYSNKDLIELAEKVNQSKAECLSIVDTFGAMYEDDLERIVMVLNSELRNDIKLGFHSHNNQQLAFALAIHFVTILQDTARKIVIDASLCGMGRGAGNATLELMANYLNKKCGCSYDLDILMKSIDDYMQYFKENYEWGYSTPYFIAGINCCHVNNISYLLEQYDVSMELMKRVIENIPEKDRRKYDYDLLEKIYHDSNIQMMNETKTIESILLRAIQ